MFPSPESTWEHWDDTEFSTVLLATTREGSAVGTIRILESFSGPLEIDAYCEGYRSQLPARSTFIEGARLVATHNESITKFTVQASLWKSAYRYALNRKIDYLIAWAKKGPDRAYKYLCFREPGNSEFKHKQLGNISHRVFYLDLAKSEKEIKSKNLHLWCFFHRDQHRNLIWY